MIRRENRWSDRSPQRIFEWKGAQRLHRQMRLNDDNTTNDDKTDTQEGFMIEKIVNGGKTQWRKMQKRSWACMCASAIGTILTEYPLGNLKQNDSRPYHNIHYESRRETPLKKGHRHLKWHLTMHWCVWRISLSGRKNQAQWMPQEKGIEEGISNSRTSVVPGLKRESDRYQQVNTYYNGVWPIQR